MDSIAENSDIDCVYVCTPTGNHAEYSIRSFEAGKHVICEKPMAPFVKDCDDMINAAKKAKKMDKSNLIGEILAKRAKEKNISDVYFDRAAYKYHGRIKQFAEILRKNGLKF